MCEILIDSPRSKLCEGESTSLRPEKASRISVLLFISSRILSVFVILLFCWKIAFDVTVNFALQRPAVQSSTWSNAVASLAVDGNLTTVSCTENSTEPWLSVDLGTPMDVGRICVVNDHAEHGESYDMFRNNNHRQLSSASVL